MTNIDKIALLRICKSIFLARTVESVRRYQKITGYTYDDFTLCSPNVFIASFDSLIKERKYATARFAISGMRFQFKPICDIKFITREWKSEITFECGRKLFFSDQKDLLSQSFRSLIYPNHYRPMFRKYVNVRFRSCECRGVYTFDHCTERFVALLEIVNKIA